MCNHLNDSLMILRREAVDNEIQICCGLIGLNFMDICRNIPIFRNVSIKIRTNNEPREHPGFSL